MKYLRHMSLRGRKLTTLAPDLLSKSCVWCSAGEQSRHRPGDCFVGKSFLLAMTYLLAACLPLDSALPTETPLPTDTPIPTPTIVWFPPSATPTLLTIPTYTPTADMK